MASEPERLPADDDTVVVHSDGHGAVEEVAHADQAWPVSDLYYVSADDEATADVVEVDRSARPEAAAPAPAMRRRFPPNLGTGGQLAALAAVVALVAVAALLGLDRDEPAATAQPPAGSPATTPAPAKPAAAKVEVADVEGMARAAATRSLERQGLRVRVSGAPSERPQDEVLTQAPAAGSQVEENAVVALVVSQGVDRTATADVTVPRVIGLRASDAVAVIRDAELVARVRLVASSDRAGTVIEQSPGAGAAATDGATVRLDVAKARTPAVTRIEVPDVVGSSASAARTALRGVGLTVATTTVASRQPAGTVVSQTPAAGSDVRKGTRVRLRISSGPTLVDVPDVTGLDESSARSELERAGLTVQVTAETVADPGQDGVVLRQTPAGGASAEDGATVTIVVGRFD